MARRREGQSILVLAALDFAAGGTGRVGGGFRMTWGLDFNILLSQESIAFFEEAAERLDYPRGLDLKQSGYLQRRPESRREIVSNSKSGLKERPRSAPCFRVNWI